MKELISIISDLKAPKNKTNTFGKFNYRDAAGILEAVKPLLVQHNCLLTCDETVKQVGERYYIVVTASITNEKGESAKADGWAREANSKTGMDDAQLTGACTSYAKKYALCNLFCIDDSSDDPDNEKSMTDEQKAGMASRAQSKPAPQPKPTTKPAPTAGKKDPNGTYDEATYAAFLVCCERMKAAATPTEGNTVMSSVPDMFRKDPRYKEIIEQKRNEFNAQK